MFRNLYAKLAAVLFGLFLLIGVLYIFLTLFTTRLYFQEVNQKVNRILAQHLVAEKILLKNGRVHEEALQDIFHMLMVVNPAIELYLLDADGAILAYSAPPGKVKRESVSLKPVEELLTGASPLPVLGDDPRDPGQQKVFSAAPIYQDNRLQGYLYIILGSQEFEAEARMLESSYIVKLGLAAATGGLLFALLAGLLLFNRMTRPLRELSSAMEAFRKSDFSRSPELLHRFPAHPEDEIHRIAAIFRQMADRITGLIGELKEADQDRREFTANITHDLRTPLASLRGYLETLLMKDAELAPEERRDYLAVAVKRSDQLGILISALFELAKLESPRFQARFEAFSLVELLQDILQKFKLAADSRKITLLLDAEDSLPRVIADIGLCERVFENLIDNALRYTPEKGSITLSAGSEGGRIAVKVSDTGTGIPAEDIPHLFDRFSKRSRTPNEAGAGSGLGLIITRRILELHGSSIRVESPHTGGTIFSFTLPVEPVQGPQ
jgi:signal transduction histidine kinase